MNSIYHKRRMHHCPIFMVFNMHATNRMLVGSPVIITSRRRLFVKVHKISHIFTRSGSAEVWIRIGGSVIAGVPSNIQVAPAAVYSAECSAEGSALFGIVEAGEAVSLTIIPKDEYGNTIPTAYLSRKKHNSGIAETVTRIVLNIFCRRLFKS